MEFIRANNNIININNNNVVVNQQQQYRNDSKQKDNKNGLNQSHHSNQKIISSSSPSQLLSVAVAAVACDSTTPNGTSISSCVSASGGVDDPETKIQLDTNLNIECQSYDKNGDQCYKSKSSENLLCKNIYVNKTCESTRRNSSTETTEEIEEEEVKPLLNVKKPKSIVKSPSTNSFGKETLYKPKLGLLCQQGDNDRHVQFSQDESGDCFDTLLNNGDKSPIGSISSHDSGSSNSSSSSGSSSNENSSLGYSEARPPDGGWGWVVVFAAFMVNLIADGVTFSFGVIYVEFLHYFGEGKAKTAWIGSLFMAMPLLSGPIASFLTDRYGCRKVTIVGSLLASAGFLISAFATSMEMLFLTFGVLAGFGLSLCYVAAVVIVAYYFDKRRSFATGLSVCGSGIGTFIFAPLTHILLEEYGWRGTTVILAGIFLNMCVCGLLMRDLEWTTHKSKQKRKKQENKISADSFSVSNSTNTAGTTSNLNANGTNDNNLTPIEIIDPNDPRLFSSLITLPTFIKNGEKIPLEVLELLSKHRNVHEHVLQNYPNLLHSRSFSEPLSPKNNELSPETTNLPPGDQMAQHPWLRRVNSQHTRSGNRTPTTAYLKDLKMHRHSLTYRGAMLNIQRYRLRASSCPDIYRNSMTTIAKEKTQWYQGADEFKNLLVSILDFSYFADIRFVLFALSNFLLYTWYDVPYVYLTDNAIEMGYNETDASMLISLIGIVNMFGEIFLGWIGDRKEISANFIYAICMGLCGVVTGVIPLLKTYTSLCTASGLFGLFIAANYSLTSIILVELITLEKFTNAYGLLLLVQGIANLIGPPLAGWIYDVTGTYDLSFYLAGLFIILSGLLLFVLPAVGKYKKYCEFKRRNSEVIANNNSYKMNNISNNVSNNKSNGAALLGDCFAKDLNKDGGVSV